MCVKLHSGKRSVEWRRRGGGGSGGHDPSDESCTLTWVLDVCSLDGESHGTNTHMTAYLRQKYVTEIIFNDTTNRWLW